MAKVVIHDDGTKEYLDDEGLTHREDGPAIIYRDGTKFWYIDGIPHSEEYPCDEWEDGRKGWYLYGVAKREGGPSDDRPNGLKLWFAGVDNLWPEFT